MQNRYVKNAEKENAGHLRENEKHFIWKIISKQRVKKEMGKSGTQYSSFVFKRRESCEGC